MRVLCCGAMLPDSTCSTSKQNTARKCQRQFVLMQNRQKPFENDIQIKNIHWNELADRSARAQFSARESGRGGCKKKLNLYEEFGLTTGEDSLENDAHRCRSIWKKLGLARMPARFRACKLPSYSNKENMKSQARIDAAGRGWADFPLLPRISATVIPGSSWLDDFWHAEKYFVSSRNVVRCISRSNIPLCEATARDPSHSIRFQKKRLPAILWL